MKFLMIPLLLAMVLGSCAESEDSTDDLLLGFLAGGGGNATSPSFRAYLSVNQTMPNTGLTKINYDTEEFDTGSNFDTTNSVFTATEAGTWYFYARSATQNTEDGKRINHAFYKNGVQITNGDQIWGSSSAVNSLAASIQDTVQVVAGDTIEVRFFHDFAGSEPILSGTTGSFFSGFRVSN